MEVPKTPFSTALGQQNVFLPTRVGPVNLESHLPYCPEELAYSSLAPIRSTTAMGMDYLPPIRSTTAMAMDCLPPLRSTTVMDMAPLRLPETNIMSMMPPPTGLGTSSRNTSLEVRELLRLPATPATPSGYFSKRLPKTNLDTTSNTKSLVKSCFTVVTDLKSPSTKQIHTTTKMTSSWYCNRDGILDLFQGLDLTGVETPVNEPDVSLFRLVSHQAPNLPKHILKWGEAKNKDIVIWSIQESRASNTSRKIRVTVPTKRRRGMRGKIYGLMENLASGKGHGRELSKSFEVIKVKEEAREAVWRLVRRTSVNPDIATKQLEAWVASPSAE